MATFTNACSLRVHKPEIFVRFRKTRAYVYLKTSSLKQRSYFEKTAGGNFTFA